MRTLPVPVDAPLAAHAAGANGRPIEELLPAGLDLPRAKRTERLVAQVVLVAGSLSAIAVALLTLR